MNYQQLNTLSNLLKGNPNIGHLKNVTKIKLLKYLKQVNSEVEILTSAQKEIFMLYGVKEENGTYDSTKLKETDLDAWNKMKKDWDELMTTEIDIPTVAIDEEEFFVFCADKKIGENTYCLNLDEIFLLSKYLKYE